MELQEFQGLALRTESQISGIKLNRTNLVTLLKLVIEVMEILDAIKKAAFYNKTAKLENDFSGRLFAISKLVETLMWLSSGRGPLGTVMDDSEEIPNVDPRVFHGILGILTESGELASALLASVENPDHSIDAVNIQEEMSDIAWYKAILHDTLKLDWGQGLENVINKLRIRYPDKYSDDAADNRDLDAERKALEVGVDVRTPTVGFDPSESIQKLKEQIKYEESLGNDTSEMRKHLESLEDCIVIYCLGRPALEWQAPAGTERGPLIDYDLKHVADVFNSMPLQKIENINPEDLIKVQPMVANTGMTFPMRMIDAVGVEAETATASDRRLFYIDLPEGISEEELNKRLEELKNRVRYTQNYTTPGTDE